MKRLQGFSAWKGLFIRTPANRNNFYEIKQEGQHQTRLLAKCLSEPRALTAVPRESFPLCKAAGLLSCSDTDCFAWLSNLGKCTAHKAVWEEWGGGPGYSKRQCVPIKRKQIIPREAMVSKWKWTPHWRLGECWSPLSAMFSIKSRLPANPGGNRKFWYFLV